MKKRDRKSEPQGYQRIITVFIFALGIVLFIGNCLAALGTTWSFITPMVTYIGLPIIGTLFVVSWIYLGKHSVLMSIKDKKLSVRRRDVACVSTIFVFLLLVPRLFPDPKISAIQEFALINARTNLIRIRLRLEALQKAAQSIGTDEASRVISELPREIEGIPDGSMDESFCRSFEFQVVNLPVNFVRAAEAYCSAIREFQDWEKTAWNEWKRDNGTQEVMQSLDDINAQLAVVCHLEEWEIVYIMRFLTLYIVAEDMGFSHHHLPLDLSSPKLYIRPYLRKKFDFECPGSAEETIKEIKERWGAPG